MVAELSFILRCQHDDQSQLEKAVATWVSCRNSSGWEGSTFWTAWKSASLSAEVGFLRQPQSEHFDWSTGDVVGGRFLFENRENREIENGGIPRTEYGTNLEFVYNCLLFRYEVF